MKLLFFSDLHMAERPPSARTADYADQLFEKLAEMRDAAKHVDGTICGGDWFHWRRPNETPHRLVQRMIGFLRTWPTPIWTVAGNHDGDGPDTLSRQPLGVLLEALKPLTGDDAGTLMLLTEPLDLDGIEIVPFNWTLERDRTPTPALFQHTRGRSVWERKQPDAPPNVSIAVAHAMIMPPGGGWPFPAIGMDELASPDIDFWLLGHTHWETSLMLHTQSGTQDFPSGWRTAFAGPGAVARTARTPGEEGRRPAYALVEVNEETDAISYERRELQCAVPTEEAFAWVPAAERRDGEMFKGYVAALEVALDVEGVPIEEALQSVDMAAGPEVGRRAREYLARAEAEG